MSNNQRHNFSSDGKYEKIVGYSRAVSAGNMIFVSGTTGVKESSDSSSPPPEENESYEQAKTAIRKIELVLNNAKSSLRDVVLTRVFLSRKADWKQVAKAHFEFFGEVGPASSMLVCEFLDPRILVEIEAQAVTLRG